VSDTTPPSLLNIPHVAYVVLAERQCTEHAFRHLPPTMMAALSGLTRRPRSAWCETGGGHQPGDHRAAQTAFPDGRRHWLIHCCWLLTLVDTRRTLRARPWVRGKMGWTAGLRLKGSMCRWAATYGHGVNWATSAHYSRKSLTTDNVPDAGGHGQARAKYLERREQFTARLRRIRIRSAMDVK
jgi:hypothetical protein